MSNLYFSEQYYALMPKKEARMPRERFVRYYNDLFFMEGLNHPDVSAYLKENAYSYAELGDAVLQSASLNKDFKNLDLIVVAYWGHEFDPDDSFGAYFSYRYGITAPMIDICDQGLLSVVSALKLIHAYVQEGKIKTAGLLCFDQMAFPVENGFSGNLPSCSSAQFMFLKSEKSAKEKYKIEAVSVKHKKNIIESGEDVILFSRTQKGSAEILSLIYDKEIYNNLPKKFTLRVPDYEDDYYGDIVINKV